jgi:hypothetical protein
MHPLAHHLGEDSLVNLPLLGGGGLTLMVVDGRARLAGVRARLARNQPRSKGKPETRMRAQDPNRNGYVDQDGVKLHAAGHSGGIRAHPSARDPVKVNLLRREVVEALPRRSR